MSPLYCVSLGWRPENRHGKPKYEHSGKIAEHDAFSLKKCFKYVFF